jgi:hypothetical protein
VKETWYVVPAGVALGRRGEGEEEVDENELEVRLLVLPPSAPRLPRRVRGKKKEDEG